MRQLFIFILTLAILEYRDVEGGEADSEVIQKGLDMGLALGEVMADKSFESSMSMLAKNVGPFLGALAPAVEILMNFIGGESDELKFMKEMFAKIERRFDMVDDRFKDVSKKIDWSTTQISLGKHENTIKVLNHALQNIVQARKEVVGDYRDKFIRLYESNWKDDPYVLYNSVTSDSLLQKNVIAILKPYMENHRGKIQKFLLGLTELVVRGISVELSYLQMKNKTIFREERQKYWTDKLASMRKVMLKADSDIKMNYSEQLKIDVEKLLRNNDGSSHEDFAKLSYDFLSEKFDWRDWFVVSYDELHGGKKHWVRYCGGLSLFRKHGRNTVIASVPKNKMSINNDTSTENKQVLKKVDSLCKRYNYGYDPIGCDNSKGLFNRLPSEVKTGCRYAGAGVIRIEKKKIEIKGSKHRLYVRRRGCYKHGHDKYGYSVFVFG
ncbi:hypothetical protein FSP39_021576 [Pinctada imbricata]|uniref:Uncharacterized protein n=1 Tax=Pinctada imbricata TaxID=66713 RepID=A0AA88XGY6_PINIB|nr:hypothetical protein FSP39_021576 [Pinctada imbricata]